MSWKDGVLQNVLERRSASEVLDIFVDSECLGKTKCYRSLGQLQNVLERLSVSECLGNTKCFRMSWKHEVLQNVLERRSASECLGNRNPLQMSPTLQKSWKDELLQKSWTASECLGKTKCFRMLWKDEVLQKSWTSSTIQNVLHRRSATQVLDSFRMSWKD